LTYINVSTYSKVSEASGITYYATHYYTCKSHSHVVGPVHPVPPHCPQSGAPVPVELVVLGFAEVVVLSFELELIVVISVVDVFEVFEVAGVEVLDVPAAVDDLPGRVETEVPEPDIVPVNLISLEPAPTYTLNVPLGIIRFWEPVSQ